jgi:hypothetical protein
MRHARDVEKSLIDKGADALKKVGGSALDKLGDKLVDSLSKKVDDLLSPTPQPQVNGHQAPQNYRDVPYW